MWKIWYKRPKILQRIEYDNFSNCHLIDMNRTLNIFCALNLFAPCIIFTSCIILRLAFFILQLVVNFSVNATDVAKNCEYLISTADAGCNGKSSVKWN